MDADSAFFVSTGDNYEHDKLRPVRSPGLGNLRQTEIRQQSTETGPDSYTVQTLNWDWAHDCKMSTVCLDWPIRVCYWVHWPIGGLALDTRVCIISGTPDGCTQSVWSHHFLCFCDKHHLTSLSWIYSCIEVKYPSVTNNECQIIQFLIFAESFSIVQ